MNALDWADHFMIIREEVLRERRFDIAADEATMIAWFANALETGLQAGIKRYEQ